MIYDPGPSIKHTYIILTTYDECRYGEWRMYANITVYWSQINTQIYTNTHYHTHILILIHTNTQTHTHTYTSINNISVFLSVCVVKF